PLVGGVPLPVVRYVVLLRDRDDVLGLSGAGRGGPPGPRGSAGCLADPGLPWGRVGRRRPLQPSQTGHYRNAGRTARLSFPVRQGASDRLCGYGRTAGTPPIA